ncbi:LysR family transcriptional regulator [Cuneatibacter sp. NSJ-177]|uniref:LysR family transcriptional regulator n=1 Tax=Cuneatibacter sp. NSJ-177 TaxID=2931401 RepID=UPI001FD23AAF|nr:LysR family transcriptional regulator [Cuneatibacter sp. NSJ-177]MCJ7836368.1 LysR family transcriptional regulator [Cuneatibacter sp. NSJ-177]
MTFRHMMIFREVAACCNMTAAAKNLYLSQSTVSLAVAEIEKTYQIRLFSRLGKRLKLTEQGELLLHYVDRILALCQEMDSALREIHTRQIHIGSTFIAFSCLLQELIVQYHIQYPDTTTRFTIDEPHVLERKLESSELDIALSEYPGNHGGLVYTPLLEDSFVLICSPSHPFAGRDTLSCANFGTEPLLLREEGNSTRTAIEAAMREKKLELCQGPVFHNIDALKKAVEENKGVSIVSEMLIQKELAEGRLHACRLTDLHLQRGFSLIYRKDREYRPQVKEFIDLCRRLAASSDFQSLKVNGGPDIRRS